MLPGMANYAIVKPTIALKQAKFQKIKFSFLKDKFMYSGITNADN